jgi:uncharacterized protein YkwD
MTRLLGGLLLTACLFVPLPLFAQTYEHHAYQEMTSPTQGVEPGAKKPHLDHVTHRIIQQTNSFRTDHGRHKLKVNPKLMRSAQDFADFMARTDKYGHTADGKQPSQRVQEQSYHYCIVAENIAWDYDSAGFGTEQLADSLMKGWEHSPPHRKNLLNRYLTDIGVGVAYSPRSGHYYAVQDFGRPRSLAVHFTLANDSGQRVTYTVDNHSYRLPPRSTMTFTTCQPPALSLQGKQESQQVVHPHNGSHYVVQRDEKGQLRLEPANTDTGDQE